MANVRFTVNGRSWPKGQSAWKGVAVTASFLLASLAVSSCGSTETGTPADHVAVVTPTNVTTPTPTSALTPAPTPCTSRHGGPGTCTATAGTGPQSVRGTTEPVGVQLLQWQPHLLAAGELL
jgi:hypothetical protein